MDIVFQNHENIRKWLVVYPDLVVAIVAVHPSAAERLEWYLCISPARVTGYRIHLPSDAMVIVSMQVYFAFTMA